MKLTPRFWGYVKDGKLQIYNKDDYEKYLANLKGEVSIVIEPYKDIRSLNQNRYYWSVVVGMIADEIGEDKDTVHDILKARFLSYRKTIKARRTGKEKTIQVVGSTARLKTDEFMDYTEQVKRWAAQNLCVFIPDPQDLA